MYMHIEKIYKSKFIFNDIDHQIVLPSGENNFRFIPALTKLLDKKQTSGIVDLTIDEILLPIDKYKTGILGKMFNVEFVLLMKNEADVCMIYSLKTKLKIKDFQTLSPRNTDGMISIAPLQVQIPAYTSISFHELTE